MVEEDEGYTKKFCLIVCFKRYFSLHPDMNSDIYRITKVIKPYMNCNLLVLLALYSIYNSLFN